MGYIGAKKIEEIYKKGKFIKITKAGFYESMVHSVEAIKEEQTINYDQKYFFIITINNFYFKFY